MGIKRHRKAIRGPEPRHTVNYSQHKRHRQTDEWWCSKCKKRWGVDEEEPDCVAVAGLFMVEAKT